MSSTSAGMASSFVLLSCFPLDKDAATMAASIFYTSVRCSYSTHERSVYGSDQSNE
jgi:hypothetical protein